MERGKKLVYNNAYFQGKFGAHIRNVCAPLSFSMLFNDEFFATHYAKSVVKDVGTSINQENRMLYKYCKAKDIPVIQQYCVIETNGKFNAPKDILMDIWEDSPDSLDECFIYFITVIAKEGGWHKQCIVQTKDNFHLLDSNYDNVLTFDRTSFLRDFYYNKLTNLSVLINEDNSFVRHRIQDYLHILQ